MWTRKLCQATLIGLATALLLTAVAGAAPPDRCSPWPDCNKSDEDPNPDEEPPWTCVARARNGASAWVIGEWVAPDGSIVDYFDRVTLQGDPTADAPVPDHYRTHLDGRAGVPACFDIHPVHVNVTSWDVVWDAAPGSYTTQKGKHGGLLMQFEREVHSDVYWEHIARETNPALASMPLQAVWDHPGESLGSLVFVAMPWSRDTWIFDSEHTLIVRPSP